MAVTKSCLIGLKPTKQERDNAWCYRCSLLAMTNEVTERKGEPTTATLISSVIPNYILNIYPYPHNNFSSHYHPHPHQWCFLFLEKAETATESYNRFFYLLNTRFFVFFLQIQVFSKTFIWTILFTFCLNIPSFFYFVISIIYLLNPNLPSVGRPLRGRQFSVSIRHCLFYLAWAYVTQNGLFCYQYLLFLSEIFLHLVSMFHLPLRVYRSMSGSILPLQHTSVTDSCMVCLCQGSTFLQLLWYSLCVPLYS